MSNTTRKSIENEFIEYNIPFLDNNGKDLSKNARKKLLLKAKKQQQKENKLKHHELLLRNKKDINDKSNGKYGINILIQSIESSNKTYCDISSLSSKNNEEGEIICFRARLHHLRSKGNIIFIILRQQFYTIQGVCLKDNCSLQMLKFIEKISLESIVDITGKLVKPNFEIKNTSQSDIEIHITECFVISSSNPLPFLLEDAERPDPLIKEQQREILKITNQIYEYKNQLTNKDNEPIIEDLKNKIGKLKDDITANKFVILKKSTRLDNRIIDLRTSCNQAIFRIKSGCCMLFREFLYPKQFIEIQSPKLIDTTDINTNYTFSLNYFGRTANLTRSPQFYKQMAISSDLNRVFEIGPVFPAVRAKTKRHLTEYIRLDIEMAFYNHYHEVLDILDELFINVFDNILNRFAKEIECVRKQYPFENLKYTSPSLRLKWWEAITLLRNNGIEIGDFEYFSFQIEKTLGTLIKEKYNTDFFILDKIPLNIRPFYTMPCAEDSRYSNSYKFFIRGQQVLSGGQEIHDLELLLTQIKKCEIDIDNISDYINCFKYGNFPHAGAGIGIERFIMLYLNLDSIQLCSLFPRDPLRLRP